MIQHIWTVPCRFSLVDQDTNNVSLIQVLEEVTIPAKPPSEAGPGLVPAMFDVFTLWGRQNLNQAARGSGRMTLLSPGDEELTSHNYEIDLTEALRCRSRGRIIGFPYKGPGTYKFRIQLKSETADEWITVATVPVLVHLEG